MISSIKRLSGGLRGERAYDTNRGRGRGILVSVGEKNKEQGYITIFGKRHIICQWVCQQASDSNEESNKMAKKSGKGTPYA